MKERSCIMDKLEYARINAHIVRLLFKLKIIGDGRGRMCANLNEYWRDKR